MTKRWLADEDRIETLAGLVGKRFLYAYANGWRYEMAVTSRNTVDYRIRRGLVTGRWLRNQPVEIVQVCRDGYRVSWTGRKGRSVSMSIWNTERLPRNLILLPQWVEQPYELAIALQNDRVEELAAFRDACRTHPIHVIEQFEGAGPHGRGPRGRSSGIRERARTFGSPAD